MPPKLGKRRNKLSGEHLAQGGLKYLTPNLSKSFPCSLYDETCGETYLDQCYILLDRLGEGSFGYVLKVLSKEDNKFYAMKISKKPVCCRLSRVKKLREIENHAKFSDYYSIVTLHGVWEEDRIIYMIMELCNGSLAQRKRLSERECWAVLLDMAFALDHLHKKGIGHFDVKPDNILCGYDGIYKLSDFGLSMELKSAYQKPPTEGDGKYLAPELLGSEVKFTEKADIFSLGISILELVGNVDLPSYGLVWSALRKNMFPRAQTQDISDELFDLLVRMMHSDLTRRPTADAILKHTKSRSVVYMRMIRKSIEEVNGPQNGILQKFVFVCSVSYIFVHLVVYQLIKESIRDGAGQKNSITIDAFKMSEQRAFATSTPVEEMSNDTLRTVDNWSTVASTSFQCEPKRSFTLRSPQLSCDVSPITLGREIKKAIKKRKSEHGMDESLGRKRKLRRVRKVLFRDDDLNSESGTDEASQNQKYSTIRRRHKSFWCIKKNLSGVSNLKNNSTAPESECGYDLTKESQTCDKQDTTMENACTILKSGRNESPCSSNDDDSDNCYGPSPVKLQISESSSLQTCCDGSAVNSDSSDSDLSHMLLRQKLNSPSKFVFCDNWSSPEEEW